MRAVLLVVGLWVGVACTHRPSNTAVTGDMAAAAAAMASELEGVWVVSLSEADLHRLTVRRMAVAETLPGEPELRAMGLSDSDLEQLAQLRALSRDAPQMVAIQEEIAHFDHSRLVVSRRTMKMQLGAREQEVGWSVTAREGDLFTLQFEGSDGTVTTGQIRLGPDDTLVLIDRNGSELIFERR